MRPDRLFAKMNAGTTFRAGRSSTDANAIRWQDVVGACQGLDGVAWLVARYLWSGEDIPGAQLLMHVEVLARHHGIPVDASERVAAVAIYELKEPNCPTCHGKGEIFQKQGVVETCPECQGHARRGLSSRMRASLARVPKSTWFRQYDGKYGELLKDLQQAKLRAARKVSKGLS